MEITVEAVPLPVYWVKKQGIKFTYDDVKQIRENVATLKKKYYRSDIELDAFSQLTLVVNI